MFLALLELGIWGDGGVGGGVDMYRVSGATKTQITICSSLYLFPNNPLVSHCSWDKDTPKILCNSCAVLKFYRWMMWLISPQCYSSDDVRVLENSLMEEKCLDVGLFSFAVVALTMFIYMYIYTHTFYFLYIIYMTYEYLDHVQIYIHISWRWSEDGLVWSPAIHCKFCFNSQ